MADQWTPEEVAAHDALGGNLHPVVLNRVEPKPHKTCFAPTTTLRWYRGPMCPDTERVLQQLWVDVMAGAKEWREIEVFLED